MKPEWIALRREGVAITGAYPMVGGERIGELDCDRINGNATRIVLPVAEWAKAGVTSINLTYPDEQKPVPPLMEVPKPETSEIPPPPYSKVVWPCPYRSQRDNDRNPADKGSHAGNECAPTSVAMVIMAFAAIDPAINQKLKDLMARHRREQPEDAISAALYQDYGMQVPGTVDLMAKLMRDFGLSVKVDMGSNPEKIRSALDRGCLLVMHGSFTRSGHVVVGRGFDEAGVRINDPWGEFFTSGYRYGAKFTGADSLGEVLGDNCPYSWGYIGRVVYWHHEVSHPTLKLKPLEVVPK